MPRGSASGSTPAPLTSSRSPMRHTHRSGRLDAVRRSSNRGGRCGIDRCHSATQVVLGREGQNQGVPEGRRRRILGGTGRGGRGKGGAARAAAQAGNRFRRGKQRRLNSGGGVTANPAAHAMSNVRPSRRIPPLQASGASGRRGLYPRSPAPSGTFDRVRPIRAEGDTPAGVPPRDRASPYQASFKLRPMISFMISVVPP
jgi:hypothetical protein